MWGIFLNSSRILKDFIKIQHACHEVHPRQDYSRKILICDLHELLCWQNFIFAKSGCYIYPPTPCLTKAFHLEGLLDKGPIDLVIGLFEIKF
jgi:hypothetical protein